MNWKITIFLRLWIMAATLIIGVGFMFWQQTVRFVNRPFPPMPSGDNITTGNWLSETLRVIKLSGDQMILNGKGVGVPPIWVCDMLRMMKHPGDRLSAWGWAPSVWLYTGLLPAQRELATPFIAWDWGPDHFHRQRYLSDLMASPPEFFLEEIGSWGFKDRSQGIGNFPELANFIQSHYTLLFDEGYRLFIRSDLIPARLMTIDAATWNNAEPFHLSASSSDKQNQILPYFTLPADKARSEVSTNLKISSNKPLKALILNFMIGPGDRNRLHLGLAAEGLASQCDSYISQAVAEQPSLCIIPLHSQQNSITITLSLTEAASGSESWIAVGSGYAVYAQENSLRDSAQN
jgi:hypothetical protein